MGEAIIQVEYSKLEMMAKQFGRHSEAVAQVKQLCERQVCRVQDGGWTGQAANAFIHEIDNRCLPVDSAAALSGLSDEASLGPAQIKIKRAKFLAEQGYLGEAAKSYNHHQIVALLLHPETNIKIAGAELKFLRDYWNEHGYDFMAKIQNGQEKDALGVWTLAYNQGPGHHFGEGPDAHSSPSYIDGKMGEWTANNYDLIDYMLKR